MIEEQETDIGSSCDEEIETNKHPKLPGIDPDSSTCSSVISHISNIKISKEELLGLAETMRSLDSIESYTFINDDNDYVDDSDPEFQMKLYKSKSNTKILVPETPDVSLTDKAGVSSLLHKKKLTVPETPESPSKGEAPLEYLCNEEIETAFESPEVSISVEDLGNYAKTIMTEENDPSIFSKSSSNNGDFSPTDGSDYICSEESSSSEINIKKHTRKVSNKQMGGIPPPHSKPTMKILGDNVKIVSSPSLKLPKNSHDKIKSSTKCDEKCMKKQEQEETITKPEKTKRTWDRKNACLFCGNLVTNFTRHIKTHHSNEKEVIEVFSINDSDPKIRKKKRQAITDSLRNRGNYSYNSKMSNENPGQENLLMPSKRGTKNYNLPSTSYVICKTCFGTYRRPTFYKHFKNCNKNPDSNKQRVLDSESIQIMHGCSNVSEDLQNSILVKLRNDEISLVIKHDPLILAFGTRMLKKKKERRSRKPICSKLRDLANLLIILRKKDPSIKKLKDVIDPKKYDKFIDAVKEMSGFDEASGFVKITSIPARIRPAILGCIEILFTESLMDPNSTNVYQEHIKKKLDNFKILLESNWQWEISSNAEKTRKRNTMIKDQVLPLDEDIEIVMRKIHELEKKYFDNLKLEVTALNYENLCEVTIAHIILLDRKRSGDVAEAELNFYINRKTDTIHKEVLESLTKEQQDAINDLDVFQIPGKRVRAVPILLTQSMRESIDLIITCRETLSIPAINQYLFARVLTAEPFDGGKCLNRIKDLCKLKNPKMLTATGMRHHIATMSQIHARKGDEYTEQLAGFLGHDVSVHAKNYRLPLQVLQKGVVGSKLLQIEPSKTTVNDISKEVRSEKNGNEMETDTDSSIANENCVKKKKLSMEKGSLLHKKQKNTRSKDDTNSKSTATDILKVQFTCTENENDGKAMESVSDSSKSDEICLKKKKISMRRTNPAKNKVIADMESDTDISSGDTDDLTDIIPKKKIVLRRKKVHIRWTEDEKKNVQKHFKVNLSKKINPGKAKCVAVLKEEPLLHKRTWEQLNTYVNNLYKKNRLSSSFSTNEPHI